MASQASVKTCRERVLAALLQAVASHACTGTDCSGRMTAETVLHVSSRAITAQGGKVPRDYFAVFRRADMAETCQKLMLGAPLGHRPLHVFGQLQNRLPPEAFKKLQGMRALSTDSDEMRSQRAM